MTWRDIAPLLFSDEKEESRVAAFNTTVVIVLQKDENGAKRWAALPIQQIERLLSGDRKIVQNVQTLVSNVRWYNWRPTFRAAEIHAREIDQTILSNGGVLRYPSRVCIEVSENGVRQLSKRGIEPGVPRELDRSQRFASA
ncbi:MAG: hypothetical protein WAN50_00860 [Minisyncoccia bacterium]